MQPTTYHFLNGDALRQQLPEGLPGEIIVIRECLVEGPVAGDTLEDLWQTRARFLEEAYGVTQRHYRSHTIAELEKIQQLPDGSLVHLWFEDDLFCQVNCWFVAHLLYCRSFAGDVFLVRPENELQYGFGGLSPDELIGAFHQKKRLSPQHLYGLSNLWRAYQAGDLDEMTRLANDLVPDFPFIATAVAAHRDRYPAGDQPGRPLRTIFSLIEALGDDDFGRIFQAFSRREAIYGFGDRQVKRLFEKAKGHL